MTSRKISRRNFLKIAGAATGTVVAAEVVTPWLFPETLEFDENASLWAPAQPQKNPPLAEDIEVDVAVIGGGFTGLSSAYHILARYPDKSVAILEARGVGHGASGRNGGMVLPMTSNEYMAVYSDDRTHRRLYDLTVTNLDDLQEFVNAQKGDVDLHRNGAVLGIARESQVEQYKGYVQTAQALGRPIEFWDQARTKSELGIEVYFGSIFEPNAAEINPMKLVGVLKQAAESAGARIYEDSPVFEIQDGETIRLLVGESNHTVTAKAIVIATNGYTSKVGYFKNSTLAIHTPMAATPTLPDSTFLDIGWKNRAGIFDSYTILYHLSRTHDNRILIGSGYVNYFFNNGLMDRDDPTMLADLLQKELGRLYPRLAGMVFEHFWSGVLGFSLDFDPTVGVMGAHQNIYYGLCYAGHGVNLSTLFGKVIADCYAGEASRWEGMPFLNHRYIPLPPEPLKWLGVQSLFQYYKAEDARK
ncbi:MAG: FAD-dependent oxidoreductase [Anaerolineales bacterium]|nr:MAG: FAD-dependent oxidoreductase [Anaerolineales bacterium]